MRHEVEARLRLHEGSKELLLTRSGEFASYGEAFSYGLEAFGELLEDLFKVLESDERAGEAFDREDGGWRLEFRPPNFMPRVKDGEFHWDTFASIEAPTGTEQVYWQTVERMLTALAQGFLVQYEHLAAFVHLGVEEFSGGSSSYWRLQKAVAERDFESYGELVNELLAATGERIEPAWGRLLEVGRVQEAVRAKAPD